MAEVASAYVSLLPSARGFGSKLNSEISGDVEASGKKAGTTWGKVFGVGAALAVGAKALSFLGDSLGEAREAQVVGARTANVIKQMGNAANISAAGVESLAGAISRKTGIDDEAIQAGQNMLLTFRNIRNEAGKGNDVFSQASSLMVDVSRSMGTDAKGAAIQLGKALNDPVKGMASLGRAGIQFSEAQKVAIKTMVESGDTLGAQKIILGEVQRQFGGAAEAMATPADKARVSVGNLKEEIGNKLLPAVDSFATFATTTLVPALSTVVDNFDTIGPILGAVTAGMVAYKVASIAAAAAAAIQAAGTTAATGATWSLNAALRANPIGLVVTALTILAAGLVLAYKKSDTFRNVVDTAFSVVKTAATVMGDAIGVVMDGMKKGFEAVGRAGAWLWNNALQPAFKFIVSGISSILSLWASMLSTLAKVPGFGWAKDAADAMANAASKAEAIAAGIKKIPNKTVTVTVQYQYKGLQSPTRGGDDDFAPSSRLNQLSTQRNFTNNLSSMDLGASSGVRDEIRGLRADLRAGLRENADLTGATVGSEINSAAKRARQKSRGGKK